MKKFTLLFMFMVTTITINAGQNYSGQKSITPTTDTKNPVTYVLESLRQGYGFPEWWFDSEENKLKTAQGYDYSALATNNHYLWYFTDAGDGQYYIHPYAAEEGHVLGAESISDGSEVIAVPKDDEKAIKWTITTNENYPCFAVTLGDKTYYLHDDFVDATKSSEKAILKESTSSAWRACTFNLGQCPPVTIGLADLSNLFNSLEYQMAYECIGNEPGQFSGDGEAYTTAYEAAKTAIESESGDFATLKTNLEEAFDGLTYNNLTTGKYYTIQNNSTKKYLAPSNQGSAMNMSDAAAVFELTTDTWLEMYVNGVWINGVNHGRGGSYHNTNKFYRHTDGTYIIAATATGETSHKILKAGDTNLTSVNDNAIDEACYWVIEEVAPTMAINSDVKYATFYAPVAVTIPDDVSAYYVSATTANSASLTALEGTIPANTGVVLYAEAGFSGAPAIVDYQAPTEGNLLSGTTKQETINKESGYSYYVLAAPASEGGVVGFYNAVNGGDNNTFVNAANKAYLKVAAEASARFLNFDFGTETAIESIEGAENGAVIYDLAGRRVQNAQKGLYIVNGKKVIK